MLSTRHVYRMSESGDCPRAIVAERIGYKSSAVPEWLDKAAREGRRHEQWIKEDLRSEGYEVEDCEVCPACMLAFGEERNGIHVEINCPGFALIGHMDARLHRNGHVIGAEIKSMSYFEFERWMKEGFGGFQEYASQITCYMHADPHEDWLYIVKNRSSGYTVRLSIKEPPTDIEAIKEKFGLIDKAVTSGKLPEVDYNPASLQCRRCKFSSLCVPEAKVADLLLAEELLAASSMWRQGKKLVAEGEGLVKNAIASFEKHTQATGIEKWKFDDLAITTVHVKEGMNYPKKKLLEVFTEEQLKPAAEIKLPYSFVRVNNLRREEMGNAEMSE